MEKPRFMFRRMEANLIEELEGLYTPQYNEDDVDEFIESNTHAFIDNCVIYFYDAWGMLRENPEFVSNSWDWIYDEYGIRVTNVSEWAYWEFYHYLYNESEKLEILRERFKQHLVL